MKRTRSLKLLDAAISRMRRLFSKRDPGEAADPYDYRMAPVRRGPKGRSGAAVAEPEEEQNSFFPPRRA